MHHFLDQTATMTESLDTCHFSHTKLWTTRHKKHTRSVYVLQHDNNKRFLTSLHFISDSVKQSLKPSVCKITPALLLFLPKLSFPVYVPLFSPCAKFSSTSATFRSTEFPITYTILACLDCLSSKRSFFFLSPFLVFITVSQLDSHLQISRFWDTLACNKGSTFIFLLLLVKICCWTNKYYRVHDHWLWPILVV